MEMSVLPVDIASKARSPSKWLRNGSANVHPRAETAGQTDSHQTCNDDQSTGLVLKHRVKRLSVKPSMNMAASS